MHLFGLVSDGGVHSSDRHLRALLEMAKAAGLSGEQVALHAFLDGRDTRPRSAQKYIEAVEGWMTEFGVGRVASVIGRYFAMDRDKRWERVQLAYDCLTLGQGHSVESAQAAIAAAYERNENDEFVKPTVIGSPDRGRVRTGDAVLFFNFRTDRARQLTEAFVGREFQAFPRASAHVTFFLSGGNERELAGERRILIPSPKVATYDLQPEMSANLVTDALLKELASDNCPDVTILNFANADMVGHSGVIEAAVSAVKTIDQCLERIVPAFVGKGGTVAVTADHGNVEKMLDEQTGGVHTAHTSNPVPFVVCSDALVNRRLKDDGRLCDIATTLLPILGLDKGKGMDGVDLFA